MKVGTALRLVPDIDLASPLRAALIASARSGGDAWGSAAPYSTLGTRDVASEDVRRALEDILRRTDHHLTEVWARYVAALEAIDRGDGAAAVTELIRNGDAERRLGRLAQARGWLEAARSVAEELADRRPEVEALTAGGRIAVELGYYEDAARSFQRALVLADADADAAAAAHAAKGLGDVALRRAAWNGAHAWYARAGELQRVAGDAHLNAELLHARGELARRTGDVEDARALLVAAREALEALDDAHNIARVLATLGLVEADAGDPAAARAALVEALAWERRGVRDAGLEAFIRLHVARLLIQQQRFLEADEELRRAEALMIAANNLRRLAHIYCVMGTSRGLQNDDTGFIFFEQALQIAQLLPHWPIVDARVRRDYAAFRLRLGAVAEARAHLSRARELFLAIGAAADAERAAVDIASLDD